MKCILLVRVSTEKQSYDEQEKELIALANSYGYDNADIKSVHNKESGIKLDEEERAGLNEMKSLIETGEYDCVFAWEISRIARRKKILFSIVEYLVKRKIQLVIKEPRIQLLKDDGSIDEGAETVFTLFSQIAESEMRNKKARFDRARREGYEKGKYMGGKVLRGYRINEDGYWEVDEEGAAFVRLVFDLYISGEYSMTELAKELKSRGCFPNISVTNAKSEISHMLKNEAYIGVRKSNNIYPQIIDNETWESCRQRRKLNRCKPKSRTQALLTPIIRCKCGASYMLNVHDGSYSCRIRHNSVEKGLEHSPDIHASVLESLAWHVALLELQDDMSQKRSDAMSFYEKEKQTYSQKIEHSKKQIASLQERRNHLDTAFYVEGKFTKEKYEELAARQNEAIKEEQGNVRRYEKAIRDIEMQVNAAVTFDEMLDSLTVSFEELKEGADFETMRKIVKRYIAEIVVEPVEGMPNRFWKKVVIKTTNDSYRRQQYENLMAKGLKQIALSFSDTYLVDAIHHHVYYWDEPEQRVPYLFNNTQPRRRVDHRKNRVRKPRAANEPK